MSSIQAQYNSAQDIADTLKSQKKQKEEIQESSERELDQLKRSYSAQKAELEDRFEASEQSERLAHYDHLRNLKNQINREERGLENAGNESISNKKNRLLKEEVMTDMSGRKRVDDLKKKYAAIEEYERQNLSVANNEAHQNHMRNTQSIMKESESALENLKQKKDQFINLQKENHSTALNEIQDHYLGIRDQQQEHYQQEVDSIEEKAFLSLNAKRLDAATRLSAYEEQSHDPFYQIQRFDSELTDQGNSYVLKVRIPEHERGNLRLQANGEDIQLVGVRTSEQQGFEQGRSVASRTHQTFSEKINLEAPIDPKSISRAESEHWVEFTIPKVGGNAHRSPASQKAQQAKEQAQGAKTSQEIRFAESLPKPTSFRSSSGKGTLG